VAKKRLGFSREAFWNQNHPSPCIILRLTPFVAGYVSWKMIASPVSEYRLIDNKRMNPSTTTASTSAPPSHTMSSLTLEDKSFNAPTPSAVSITTSPKGSAKRDALRSQ